MKEGTLAQVLVGEADWVVVEGDCLEVLPTIPDKAAAHVITDPPYEAEAHTLQRRVKATATAGSDWGGQDDRIAKLDALNFPPMTEADREAVGLEFGRIASRWVLAFCQVEASQLWRGSLVAGGLKYRRTAIWVKPDGQPQLSGDRPGMGYESIVACHAPGRSVWNGGGKCGVFTFNKNGPDGKNPHPTTKPLPLMLEFVALFTDPGDLVLDPFCGSGTTLVAALRLGRRAIGIEKDHRYAEIARERLRAEAQGLSLRDARAGQTSLFGESP